MLKKFILSVAILIPFGLRAQLNISIQIPVSGIIQKEQLWNLSLINNGSAPQEITLKLNLQDAETGETVLSANSASILIGKGVKVLRSNDVQPVNYNFGNNSFNGKYLPVGSYKACYQVFAGEGEHPMLLALECTPLLIEPLSPPVLTSPGDQTELQDPYPQFTWMPPSPYDMFSNLNYEIRVAEIHEGQSSSDALEYNTPVYIRDNLQQNHVSYPASYEKLDTGKVYAWQVIAHNGTSYAAKTEIWTFTLAGSKAPKLKLLNNTYISLLPGEQGTYLIHKDELHVKYYSYQRAHNASLRFIDAKGNIIKNISKKVIPGENRFDLDIRKSFSPGQVYKLLLKENQKNYYLKFIIK